MSSLPRKKSRKLLYFLILAGMFCLAGFSLWYGLKQGITLDHIHLASIRARQVSIRLDNGLIIGIERLEVKKPHTENIAPTPERLVRLYDTWFPWLQEVRINQLDYQDQTYKVQFKDQQFSISGTNFDLLGTLTFQPEEIQADIALLKMNFYPGTIAGTVTYAYNRRNITFSGNFNGPLVSGKLIAELQGDQLEASLSTNHFTDLAGVLARFPIDREVISWVGDNISASYYRISELKLKTILVNGKPELHPDSISGEAVAAAGSVLFEPSLPPINTKQILVSYAKDRLSFTLDEPYYKDKSLAGSDVRISNLIGKDSHLIIDIRTDSRLDADIHEVLGAYDIQLPLTQQKGTTRAELHLDFDLPAFDLQSSADFTTSNSQWNWRGFLFNVNRSTVLLQDNLVTIDRADLVMNSDLEVELSGTVDTAAKKAVLKTKIEQFKLQASSLNIDFSNPGALRFTGRASTPVFPLFREDEQITDYSFQGNSTDEKFKASINGNKIAFSFTDSLTIRLRDYSILLDLQKIGNRQSADIPFPVIVSGAKSQIRTDNLSIPTKSFRATLKDSAITFAADLEQGKILFEKNGEGMSLTATDTDALIAQDFFPFADLEGGRFNLSLKGTDQEHFEGFVEFNNVVIRDMMMLNNVLSFINTIPALATLSSPGFDKNGYSVEEGVAHFTMSGKLLTINELRTNGVTINTETEGWVDLENDILKIDLQLISLKDYSKIISKIPWAGYVLLGENGSISTSLRITGDRGDPEITTNLPGEIVMLPVNMVKRTVKWPFQLFNRIKELAVEQPETEPATEE